MSDRLTLAELEALRDECIAFRAEMRKRHDSGWTYNKPAWRLWGNAESLLSELIERREKEAADAAHSQAIGEMMDHFKDDAEAKEAADGE